MTLIRKPVLHSLLLVAFSANLARAAAPTQAATEPRPAITMSDVIAMRGSSPRDLSFDGDAILGSVDAGPGRTEQVTGSRHLVQWRDGKAVPLEEGEAPALSPDGHWILFTRGHTWILKDRRTGATRTFDAGKEVSATSGGPVWSADSRFVAANFELRGESVWRKDEPALKAPGVRAVVYDVRDGSAIPSTLVFDPQVMTWDVTKDQPQMRSTGGHETFPGSWRTTAQGHDYYYVASQEAGAGLQAYTSVRDLQVEHSNDRELYRFSNFIQTAKPQISPDGRHLALVADPYNPHFAVTGRVLVLDLDTGRLANPAPEIPVTALRWGSDGRIYFLKQHAGLAQLGSVGLAGDVIELTHDEVSRRDIGVSSEGDRLVYAVTDGYGRTELRIWSLRSKREQSVVVIQDPGARYQLGRFELTSFTTPDNVKLLGYLFYPPGFDPKRKYPLMVDIHGGGPGSPLGFYGLFAWRARNPLDWHAWAAQGYVVFLPDYRSSGEYGSSINVKVDEQAEDILDIDQDAMDVASGVESIVHRGFVDPTRIAGTAHSAGGARLGYLLVHTKLFAAGIVDDPVPFGPDAYMLSVAKYGGAALWTRARLPPDRQDKLGATFLFDLWRVTTPTLVLVGDLAHGSLDPLSAETLYAMLLSQGVATRFVHYVDDGHVPLSDASSLDHFNEMRAWLERYAPPGAAAEQGVDRPDPAH